MIKNPFIGIAGNIGVGKTTFTSFLAKEFKLEDIYESVTDNPYLSDFYSDMNRWSFNLQIYFLHHRFSSIIDISKSNNGFVQDRTIYEDVEIFSRNLHDMGYMDNRDWQTYSDLFKNMTKFLKSPDLIIYLKADLDTILDRINKRSRDYEATIDPEYLKRLNLMYNEWIENIRWTKVLVIDTNSFNIFEDKGTLESIYNDVRGKLK
jgi:deoxyadenosine/deoxycytidine kinase